MPFSVFWLVEGDVFLGQINIRHELDYHLRRWGGHVGYAIRPSRRGRGYGKLILEFGLEACRRLGIGRVLVTCEEVNLASARAIEANGGRLANVVDGPAGSGRFRRYWISLSAAALPLDGRSPSQ